MQTDERIVKDTVRCLLRAPYTIVIVMRIVYFFVRRFPAQTHTCRYEPVLSENSIPLLLLFF